MASLIGSHEVADRTLKPVRFEWWFCMLREAA
jgi:hypothetical protein